MSWIQWGEDTIRPYRAGIPGLIGRGCNPPQRLLAWNYLAGGNTGWTFPRMQSRVGRSPAAGKQGLGRGYNPRHRGNRQGLGRFQDTILASGLRSTRARIQSSPAGATGQGRGYNPRQRRATGLGMRIQSSPAGATGLGRGCNPRQRLPCRGRYLKKWIKKGAVGNRAFVMLGMGIPAYFKMTIFRMVDVSSVSSW